SASGARAAKALRATRLTAQSPRRWRSALGTAASAVVAMGAWRRPGTEHFFQTESGDVMRLRNYGLLAILGSLVWIGCGCSGEGDTSAAPPPTAQPSPPPQPTSAKPACVISADCPAGTHCDLEQCIQDCNTAVACSDAATACSSRGRCMPAGHPDSE